MGEHLKKNTFTKQEFNALLSNMSVASKYLYLKSSYHSRISMIKKIMRTNLRYHFVQNDKVS